MVQTGLFSAQFFDKPQLSIYTPPYQVITHLNPQYW